MRRELIKAERPHVNATILTANDNPHRAHVQLFTSSCAQPEIGRRAVGMNLGTRQR